MAYFPITKGKLKEPYADYGYNRPAYRYESYWDENGEKKTRQVMIPGKWVRHKAIDLSNIPGKSENVYSPVPGRVIHLKRYHADSSWWPTVVVVQELNKQIFHLFGHLDHNLGVALHDPVSRGQLIGKTASEQTLRRIAPNSHMGTHLHYEVLNLFNVSKPNALNMTEMAAPLPKWPDNYCDPLMVLASLVATVSLGPVTFSSGGVYLFGQGTHVFKRDRYPQVIS